MNFASSCIFISFEFSLHVCEETNSKPRQQPKPSAAQLRAQPCPAHTQKQKAKPPQTWQNKARKTKCKFFKPLNQLSDDRKEARQLAEAEVEAERKSEEVGCRVWGPFGFRVWGLLGVSGICDLTVFRYFDVFCIFCGGAGGPVSRIFRVLGISFTARSRVLVV